MKITIGNKTISLIDRDVKVAKSTIKHFLDVSREEAEKKKATSYYYTLIIAMYIMSSDMINALTPDVLSTLLNAASDNYEEKQEG